jgi:hypothetical protein
MPSGRHEYPPDAIFTCIVVKLAVSAIRLLIRYTYNTGFRTLDGPSCGPGRARTRRAGLPFRRQALHGRQADVATFASFPSKALSVGNFAAINRSHAVARYLQPASLCRIKAANSHDRLRKGVIVRSPFRYVQHGVLSIFMFFLRI